MVADIELREQCRHAHHVVLKHIELLGVSFGCALLGLVFGIVGAVSHNTMILLVGLLPLLLGLGVSLYARTQLPKDKTSFDLLQTGQCPNRPDEPEVRPQRV